VRTIQINFFKLQQTLETFWAKRSIQHNSFSIRADA